MVNERTKQPRFGIAVIAVAAVMLVAATTEMAISGYVFAYNRNQATSAANDCGNGQVPTNIGCQNTDSQIQGDENSVALTSQQTFPSVTREPPTTEPPSPTGFTITGTGETTGVEFVCTPPVPPGLAISLEFSAESDGTVTGTYTVTATGFEPFTGELTDGTTDGNTFTLSGMGDSVCIPEVIPNLVTISGDCGDDVTVTYKDESAEGTFTGDVECILT
jgi:hypothetical protein